MNHISTKTIESKVCQGASFTIKKMTVRRKQALDDKQAPFGERLRPLREELAPLNREYSQAWEAAKAAIKPERDKLAAEGITKEEAEKRAPVGKVDFPDERFQRWSELTEKIRRIDRDEMTPAAVRFCLVKIEGLEIDGIPATLESLLENGPDEFYDELAQAVARELGLLPEEATNLGSLSTSAAAVDGNPTASSAAPVETPATITSGDAASFTVPASAIVPTIPSPQ